MQDNCPECGSERSDYALDGRAMCVNRHVWTQTCDSCGAALKAGEGRDGMCAHCVDYWAAVDQHPEDY